MSIKPFICIILSLVLHWSVLAQKDTTFQTIRQEEGTYTAPVIETPADRLFRTKVPSRLMIKANMSGVFAQILRRTTNYGVYGTPVNIGAEYKILPAFSIGISYGMGIGEQPYRYNFERDNGWIYSAALTVEGRWYHDMKKRIEKGRSANNFGGKYLALQAHLDNNPTLNNAWESKKIDLRYGLQQRYMRNGYFDASIGAGIGNYFSGVDWSTLFSTDQKFIVGLAAFLPKMKDSTQRGDLCDILHCQDEQNQMLKINLFNVFNVWATPNYHNVRVAPSITFEKKIGRSPFSVEATLEADYISNKNNNYVTTYDLSGSIINISRYTNRYAYGSWYATGELRWYHNMRKRVLQGRSGNNLSGGFLALQIDKGSLIKNSARYTTTDGSSRSVGYLFGLDYWAGNFVIGNQQRLFNEGFFQYKFGMGHTFGGYNYAYGGPDLPLRQERRPGEFQFVADVKIGFAF